MNEYLFKIWLRLWYTLFNDNYSPSDKFDIILNEIFSNKVDSNKQSLIYSFQISNLITPNQKGQILDVGIKYKYRQDVINNNYGNNNQQNSSKMPLIIFILNCFLK